MRCLQAHVTSMLCLVNPPSTLQHKHKFLNAVYLLALPLGPLKGDRCWGQRPRSRRGHGSSLHRQSKRKGCVVVWDLTLRHRANTHTAERRRAVWLPLMLHPFHCHYHCCETEVRVPVAIVVTVITAHASVDPQNESLFCPKRHPIDFMQVGWVETSN